MGDLVQLRDGPRPRPIQNMPCGRCEHMKVHTRGMYERPEVHWFCGAYAGVPCQRVAEAMATTGRGCDWYERRLGALTRLWRWLFDGGEQ